ncbi:MAG: MFS transporter [Ardenticatenaceae bacterium]|nr:MFS transporter [Ardenticatenaceae bacterium]
MKENAHFTVRDLLRIREFRWLWLGQIVSNFGDAVTHLTLVLFINRVTEGSTTAIAYLLIALALPRATIGLVAGVFADRWDRKRTMIVSDLLRGVLILAFIFLSVNNTQLWLLYMIAFIHSAIGAFFLPARSALIPNLVPKEGLLAANSLSQMSMVFLQVLGTAAAGFIVGVLDTFWPAFVIDAVTFFVSALFVAQVQVATQRKETRETAVSTLIQAVNSELREGMRIMLHNRVLLGTLVAIGVTMFGLGAVNVLLPPLLINDLHVSETWFGAVEFAQTLAMIISGSFVAILAARFKPTSLISGNLLILGVMVCILSLITTVWHVLPILFVIGLVVTPLNAAVATIVQTAVSDDVRGRISAALGAIVQAAMLISMFATGAVAAAIGVRNVFIVSGIIVVTAGIIAGWIFRSQHSPQLEIELQPSPEHL